MKFFKLLVTAPCVLLCIPFSNSVFAACVRSDGLTGPVIYTAVADPIPTFSPNVPDGTVLATGRFVGNTPGGVTSHVCNHTLDTQEARSTLPYAGSNIYTTPIPGIGIRFRTNGGHIYPFSIYSATTIGPSPATVTLNYELIKTGPITSGGELTGTIAEYHWVQNVHTPWQVSLTNDLVVEPIIPTCTPNTSSLAVNLGQVPFSSFDGSGRSPRQDFSIEMTCADFGEGMTSDINVTLTDQNQPANRTSQLSLNGGSTATGVVLEVYNRFGVVSFGPDSDAPDNPGQWSEGAVGNGAFSIPLSVNYLRTAPSATAGTANADATYTLSYQ